MLQFKKKSSLYYSKVKCPIKGMFPWDKHTTLWAVVLSPDPFIPCQMPEREGRSKQAKAQQKKKTILESGVLEPCLCKIHPSGIHLLVEGHLKLQLLPAVPLTRPLASPPCLFIKWSVCNSLWAEHTMSLCLKMTGRNRSKKRIESSFDSQINKKTP